MATISKFYLHAAATGNTGTMPSGAFIQSGDVTGDATGARTARAADDVIGVSQTSPAFTSTANVSGQSWGFARFVSAPLAAQTFAAADGNWTFSYARSQSNANHNGRVEVNISAWSPTTGLRVGGGFAFCLGTIETLTTVAAESVTGTWNATPVTISNGDILVFEVFDSFTQAMSTAYTSTFFYDGTTEASTTSCASFVTPPAALTLFSAAAAASPPRQRVVSQAVQRAASRCWSKRPSGIFVPRLWTPEAA